MYLHDTSCHNRASIKGILKSVVLPIRRLCTTDEEFQQRSNYYIVYLVSYDMTLFI